MTVVTWKLAHENKSFSAEPNLLAEIRRHAVYFYHRRHQNLCFLREHYAV